MKRIASLLAALLLVSFGAQADIIKIVAAGATDQTVTVKVLDSATGVPSTDLAFNSSGIDLEYWRHGANAAVDITEATQTVNGAHSDGGFVHIGAGVYRLDLPDAAVASGATAVDVYGVITGEIVIGGTVALTPPVNSAQVGGQTASASGTVTFPNATLASTTNITAGTIATVTNLTNLPTIPANWITAAGVAADAIGASEVAADVSTELLSGLANLAVNVAQISGDSTAADNQEALLDLIVNVGNGAFPPYGISASGTAQAYTSGTPSVTLAAATAAADDNFNGHVLTVWGDEGEVHSACITDFVGATDIATIDAALPTAVTGTIRYVAYATPSCEAAGASLTAQNVWEYATRTLTALDEDSTTIDLNASYVGGVTVFDEDLTTIDINATTIGTVTTATNVTTVNGLAANTLTAAALAADALAEINTEVDTALTDIHLDHLLAATYDPASKPGAADALLNELVESDAGVSRCTANSLEQAPSGTGASATAIADEVQTRTIAAVTLVNGFAANSITAAAAAADFTTEVQSGLATAAALDAVDNLVDTEVAAILAAVDTEIATLQTSVDDVPTNAELSTALSAQLTSQRILTGTCDSGSETTCVDDALTQAAESQLDDRLVCFSDSWCALVTGFTPATDTLTTTKTAPSTRASLGYTIFPATAQ